MSNSNPNELQPTGMSDEDVERFVNNYVTQNELKNLDPSKVTWSPLNADNPDLPEMPAIDSTGDSQ